MWLYKALVFTIFGVIFWCPPPFTRHTKFRAQTDRKNEVSLYYGNRDKGWYNKVAADGRFVHISLYDEFLVVFVVGFQFLLQDVDEFHRLDEEWDVLPYGIQPPLNLVVKGIKLHFRFLDKKRVYSVVGCEGIIMGIRTVLSVNAERMFASTCRAVHTERKR